MLLHRPNDFSFMSSINTERTKKDRIALFRTLMNRTCEAYIVPTMEKNKDWLDTDENLNYFIDWLDDIGYFTAPATTTHHGNWEGGLFDHSVLVALLHEQYCLDNALWWDNARSPVFLGLFHDIAKVEDYKLDMELSGIAGYNVWVHDKEPKPISGHGEKSVIMLSGWTILDADESLAIIHHHGAYNTDKRNEYNAAVKRKPGIMMLHVADMTASKFYGI